MDYSELFPGRFLKAGDFKGREVTLTLTEIHLEDMPQDDGTPRKRAIVSFKESKRQLVLNRTNGEAIKGMFGPETDNWLGKRVTFFPARIQAFGGEEWAIRVRGSPDLAEDMDVQIKLPRKNPRSVRMTKTGAKLNGGKPAPKKMEIIDVPAGEEEPTL
jgi:hypothetical protein